jgi:pantoate kinase
MESTAFCPAHVTGFFKAHIDESQEEPAKIGSMGAGFSIKEGVTTSVKIVPRTNQKSRFRISAQGYESDKTDITEFVLDKFLKMGGFNDLFFDIKHKISIPVGYGLGSSSAVALSLAFALDQALQTRLDRDVIGRIAHSAELNCKTGLGDVLASYYGGFEIRVKPGAPGVGKVEKIETKPMSVIMICFSPISTNKFLKERLAQINGLGGKMVDKLLASKDYEHFQDMSLEFAKYVNVITPKMEKVIKDLIDNKIKCGVALFGETIFSMIPKEREDAILKILEKYNDGIIVKSEIDTHGARVLKN